MKGVKVTGLGGHVNMARGGGCQHQRGGYCLLHGEGAVKKLKPVIRTTTGGISVTRQVYYECEGGHVRVLEWP